MTLEAVIISQKHRRIAARLVERISFYDYKACKVALVPPPLLKQMRARTAALLETQSLARQKVRDLEVRVDQFVKEAT